MLPERADDVVEMGWESMVLGNGKPLINQTFIACFPRDVLRMDMP